MKTPDDVAAMVRLKQLGWGAKRIAAELGCSRNTVRRWLTKGGWRPCGSPSRSKQLDGLDDWLRERFRRHGGNADVVRQELALEKGVIVSLRTVERAVAPLRRELVAAAQATVRFETAPGQQLQIDFGERRVEIGEAPAKVFFFVATLGYSRRLHVRAYGHEKRDSWFDGMESAFRAFWVCRRSAARQRAGADPPPRSSEPGGRAASAASRVFRPLGLPRSRRRAVPGSHEGQGRAGRRLRQEECDRPPALCHLGRTRGASGELDAGDRRRARSRHARRTADRAVPPRRGGRP